MGMDCILKKRKSLTFMSLFAFCLLLAIRQVQAIGPDWKEGELVKTFLLIIVITLGSIIVILLIRYFLNKLISYKYLKEREKRRERARKEEERKTNVS